MCRQSPALETGCRFDSIQQRWQNRGMPDQRIDDSQLYALIVVDPPFDQRAFVPRISP